MRKCKNCLAEKELTEFYPTYTKAGSFRGVCKTCHKRNVDSWRKENPGLYTGYIKSWKKANPEKVKTIQSNYWKRNPDKLKEKWATKQARRQRRSNFPLTKIQRAEITAIYAKRPEGFEVDHIVPLQGKTVSGLHVPWNLQYLSVEDNRKKSNRLVG